MSCMTPYHASFFGRPCSLSARANQYARPPAPLIRSARAQQQMRNVKFAAVFVCRRMNHLAAGGYDDDDDD